MSKKLIRFDWAMKKLLRHNRNADRANFDILEGFLSELLRFDVMIESILESESNRAANRKKMNMTNLTR